MSNTGYTRQKTRLGDLLLVRGLITPAQLQQALRIQADTNQRLGEILVRKGWISAWRLWWILRHQTILRWAFAVFSLVSGLLAPFGLATARSDAEAARTASATARISIRIPPRVDIKGLQQDRLAIDPADANGSELSLCMLAARIPTYRITAEGADQGSPFALNDGAGGQLPVSITLADGMPLRPSQPSRQFQTRLDSRDCGKGGDANLSIRIDNPEAIEKAAQTAYAGTVRIKLSVE